MLALYPSNKLEHLSFLLTTLLQQQPNGVFVPETILVESPGMQHWVSMQLAREQGVAMNIDFPLPVRFMWNTARMVLGEEKVPRQSPYRREVLVWRIDNLLKDESLINEGAFEQVNKYWQGAGSSTEQGVQRLQLATALADVYEQYLLYRPDWLFAWERNERIVFDDMEMWQSAIWRELVKDQPLHPARLHQLTLQALSEGQSVSALPNRVIVFAINTMAPQLISFFDALAQHIDIHIFHLNPSVNYWGDAKSTSEQAKQLRMEGLEKWMSEAQPNVLLGNLGKQGRELFNLLTELDTFEISAFDSPQVSDTASQETPCLSLLEYIQDDILQAKSPSFLQRQNSAIQDGDEASFYTSLKDNDDSVSVMCTHSALREVQTLHDHLLHWLSQDKSRTPSDILVMCPAIENYAPFVDAVFHRVGTKSLLDGGPVRLPCTIADRTPMDAEPLIAAYMALLHLPDSRFGVSDIMDYLQLDAVQKRFSLDQNDIDQMVVWLKQAHIHWGLDSEHKDMVSEGVTSQDTYSWWWGIRRLLIGMLAPDREVVIDSVLTIPDVEGQSALTLGKLIEIVDLLELFSRELTQPRAPQTWAKDLIALRDACFKPVRDQEQSWDLIAKVAADLSARCDEASYEHELSLRQIRELLLNRFSSPDAGNHFMTGQVTVCSMLPMRSIPFKKVCILGLNDSEFPRKSTPLGLDLMAVSARRIGDRSRRLEDRYLFLEAIISTRESLYLSYQGNDVTNNSERQPSLVLGELLDMLSTGYGLELSDYVTHAPLHPFSESAFTGTMPSYETGWLRLSDALRSAQRRDGQVSQRDALKKSDSVPEEPINDSASMVLDMPDKSDKRDTVSTNMRLSSQQVSRAFNDPLAFFSIQRLGVNLSQSFTLLENSEPFETNALVRYQVLDTLFSSPERVDALKDDSSNNTYSDQVIEFAALRGDIPNNPVAREELEMWRAGALALNHAMGPHDADPKIASFEGEHFTFTTSAFEASGALAELCAGKINVTRALGYFISQLIFSSSDEATSYTQYPLDIYYCDWEKGETTLMKRRFAAIQKETAKKLLRFIESLFVKLYTAPTPLYSSLIAEIVPGKRRSDSAALVSMASPEHFDDIVNAMLDCDEQKPASSETVAQLIVDTHAFFDGADATRAIGNWQQSSGQFTADMANNAYLKWLYPQGVTWQDMPYVEGFLLFAMVANASVEEKL